jgi:hypothetical protein
MNMLANLKLADGVDGEEKDVLGGGRGPLESDAYPATITMAYMSESEGGATALNITAMTEDGKEIRGAIYVTSGRAKGQKTTYEKDGKTYPLPGFLLVNSLCQLATGKEISQLETEEKVIKLYNFDAKAEVPTKVPVVVELLQKQIVIGLLKQTVDKSAKNDAGVYVATGETREENEIDKFFCARDGFENLTLTEVKTKAAGGEIEKPFHADWVEKNKGQTRNKAKGAAGGGTAGAPGKAGAAAAGGTAKPKSSLFG